METINTKQIPQKFIDPETGAVRVDALANSYRELERRLSGALPSPQTEEGKAKMPSCHFGALGLIAAQPAEILVHSNLDDGFAGLFQDMTSAFGMALIEKYIVEDLVGASLAFCFGHHFSAPLTRAAFQAALGCAPYAANTALGVERASDHSSSVISASMSPKRGVDRYRSPVSGSVHRITEPGAARWATSKAAAKVAPQEIPQKIPSFCASA